MTTAVTIAPNPILQFFNNQQTPCVGGSVLTQVGGINATTYQDSAGNVPLPNPIPLNNRGEISNASGVSCQLFLATGSVYTFTLFDANGNQLNQASYVSSLADAGTFAAYVASIASNIGSSLIGFLQAGVGAVLRTVQAKLRESVSIVDYGAVGDGVTDDTAAINAAFVVSKNVLVPAGLTPLISSTIAMPAAARLEFKGGFGNSNGAYPPSYFIKKATMTTPGITLADRAWIDGGGVFGQGGNTGDGVAIQGNSCKISNFLVHGAGGNGVRIGKDVNGGNYNTFELSHVVSQYNGGRGFYIHDGTSAAPNANAGKLDTCFAQFNTGDGFTLGHCFWVTALNCLSEVNTGFGIQTMGTNDGSGVPICRYPNIVGGDFNEGNTAGQIFEQGYFANWSNPDPANCPSNAGSGLAGSGVRNVMGSQGANAFVGGVLSTSSGTIPWTLDDGTQGNMSYWGTFKKQTTGSNGSGTGLQWNMSTGSGFNITGQFRHLQYSTNNWGFAYLAYKASVLTALLNIDPTTGIYPGMDNTISCGASSFRWSVVYAATGAINTSDQREKQDIRAIDDKERAVAVRLKSMVRAFRWNDAVTKKGDDARIHVGFIAQEVFEAFTAEGLDPFAYACCCHDVWEATEAIYNDEPVVHGKADPMVDGEGNQILDRFDKPMFHLAGSPVIDKEGQVVTERVLMQPAREAGDRYGLRVEQLHSFILATL